MRQGSTGNMTDFEYFNPVKIVFGKGNLSKLGEEAKKYGSRILLVSYERPSPIEFILSNVESLLSDTGADYTHFYKIKPNPSLSTVQDGVELCRKNNIDLVIAVGGGSVIDSAKIIAAGVYCKDELWNHLVSRQNESLVSSIGNALPIIAVPTVSATSSEMNSGAVITNDLIKEKAYVFSDHLFPKTAILDPSLMTGVPTNQLVCGNSRHIMN